MRNCVGGFFLNVAGRPEFPVLDPERSDDSPNSCRSRAIERTLTLPPVDPDRFAVQPATPLGQTYITTWAKLRPTEAMRRPPQEGSRR
jgi:hypothetical protein